MTPPPRRTTPPYSSAASDVYKRQVSGRVLRYYGNAVDEHEIAQLAGTTAEVGTSVDALREVVRTVGQKEGLG